MIRRGRKGRTQLPTEDCRPATVDFLPTENGAADCADVATDFISLIQQTGRKTGTMTTLPDTSSLGPTLTTSPYSSGDEGFSGGSTTSFTARPPIANSQTNAIYPMIPSIRRRVTDENIDNVYRSEGSNVVSKLRFRTAASINAASATSTAAASPLPNSQNYLPPMKLQTATSTVTHTETFSSVQEVQSLLKELKSRVCVLEKHNDELKRMSVLRISPSRKSFTRAESAALSSDSPLVTPREDGSPNNSFSPITAINDIVRRSSLLIDISLRQVSGRSRMIALVSAVILLGFIYKLFALQFESDRRLNLVYTFLERHFPDEDLPPLTVSPTKPIRQAPIVAMGNMLFLMFRLISCIFMKVIYPICRFVIVMLLTYAIRAAAFLLIIGGVCMGAMHYMRTRFSAFGSQTFAIASALASVAAANPQSDGVNPKKSRRRRRSARYDFSSDEDDDADGEEANTASPVTWMSVFGLLSSATSNVLSVFAGKPSETFAWKENDNRPQKKVSSPRISDNVQTGFSVSPIILAAGSGEDGRRHPTGAKKAPESHNTAQTSQEKRQKSSSKIKNATALPEKRPEATLKTKTGQLAQEEKSKSKTGQLAQEEKSKTKAGNELSDTRSRAKLKSNTTRSSPKSGRAETSTSSPKSGRAETSFLKSGRAETSRSSSKSRTERFRPKTADGSKASAAPSAATKN